MTIETSSAAAPRPGTRSTDLALGEDLVLARSGRWRLLIPMRHVERIHGAVLPAVAPSAGPPSRPLVSIAGTLIPVVFCDALLGAPSVTLAASDMMILLRHERRRALLWVSAAEEVVPFEPVGTDAALPSIALAFSGRDRAHAVLDVPKLIDLAVAPPGRDGDGMGVAT